MLLGVVYQIDQDVKCNANDNFGFNLYVMPSYLYYYMLA